MQKRNDRKKKACSLIASAVLLCSMWIAAPSFAEEENPFVSAADGLVSEGEVSAGDLFDEYGFSSPSAALRSAALESAADFIDMGSVSGVDLKKTWTIKFSRAVSIDKDVESITIQRPGSREFVPVRINLGTTGNHITVTPADKFSGGNDYELRIILRNGKRYKKSFRTASEHRNADIEPNDSRANPSRLELNEIISGSNTGEYDYDFYKIQIPEYGYLYLSLTSQVRKDLYFYQSFDGDYKYRNTGTTIDYSLPLSPGTYYIAVRKDSSWDPDDIPYILENRFTPTKMPGDQASSSYVIAPEVSFDRPIQGLLGFFNDQGGQNLEDYYKIVLDQPANLRITGSDVKGESFRIVLYGERGTDGDRLTYSEAIVPLIEKQLPAGTYYLGIWDDTYSYTWKSLEYELQISRH
ncbi:MAG: hypothetical protein Q4A78_05865 [Peptostreptococcaceae bacterium]|nr:hypothetical protein [Peptostreptococcaceae bacterium]